jgi:surfeit locus 1 family protein
MTRRRLPPYLAPRILGLTALALVMVAGMTTMGVWQLDVYRQSQSDDAAQVANARPAPLDSLLSPDQAFTARADAHPVTAEGTYDEQQIVVDRGAGRPWLVAPLVTDSGSAILVVRGLLTGPAAATGRNLPPPPTGAVRVVGSLQPSEGRGNDTNLADNRVPTLSTAQLISDVRHDLYSGYVVLTGQTPRSTLPEATPPQPDASFTAGLRNLMYALQWWLFAGFVIFLWWRMVREESRVA